MYIDDEMAITVRDMAQARKDADLALATYDRARKEVINYMREHNTDCLTTDEYSVALNDRSTVRINRRELEQRDPKLFEEVADISVSTVVTIRPR